MVSTTASIHLLRSTASLFQCMLAMYMRSFLWFDCGPVMGSCRLWDESIDSRSIIHIRKIIMKITRRYLDRFERRKEIQNMSNSSDMISFWSQIWHNERHRMRKIVDSYSQLSFRWWDRSISPPASQEQSPDADTDNQQRRSSTHCANKMIMK
jgi:hypothetical protein